MVEHSAVNRKVGGSFPPAPAKMKEQKPLTKKEKFACEITWGNVPVDITWIRNSKLFIETLKEVEEGKYTELWQLENKTNL